MQPLPTEAGPRSLCAQCGEPLPPPTGTPTFVYGVGPVGYQDCLACGAKWRYLWQDAPEIRVKPERGRRLFVVVGAAVLAAGLAITGFALAQSKRWGGGSATPTTTSDAPPSTSAPASVRIGPAVARAYDMVSADMNAKRDDFMSWVHGSAQATPQYQVHDRAKHYSSDLAGEINAIQSGSWPSAVSHEVGRLLDADRALSGDIDLVQFNLLGSPSFVQRLDSDADAVAAADRDLREKLGLSTS